MKSIQIIAHTAGGEVKSAVEQVTERDYEAIKDGLTVNLNDRAFITFNTDEGCVIIPGAQIFYIEVQVF